MSTDHALSPAAPQPQASRGAWPYLRETWELLYKAGLAWSKDNAMRLSAAVAMYTILSLSPLLVITIKVTAVVLHEEEAKRQVQRQVEAFLGPTGAKAVEGMIVDTMKPGAGVLASLISLGILLFTASGVFNEFRDALNSVFQVQPKTGRGIWASVRERLLSMGMVFVIGFLLLVSQVLTVTLTVLSEYVFGGPGWAAVAVDLVVSTVVIAALFGALFRVLPDVKLSWGEVLFGSVVTAVLFKVGQYGLALYFAHGTTASTYGAAGSFVVVLLWVYYSCWIVFYGAELIRERMALQGRQVEPSDDAVRVELPPEQQWQGKQPK